MHKLIKMAAFCVFTVITLFSMWISAEAAGADNAKAAVVMEAQSGRVLFSKAGDRQLPMASTTKLMTALVTLEQPDLDSYFTVDPQAIKVEGSSMGLQEGDQVTLRILAWGMMLASGNDAAGAAAVRIAGSTESFALLMNAKAAEIGMDQSHFVTPSGLDHPDHYTTAEDMAKLAKAALQNDILAEIVSTKNQKLEYGNPPYTRWLQNHNKLLWSYSGTIGLKTGYTSDAGRCLVSAAKRGGVTLITVTLGCPDDFRVHSSLFDSYFSTVTLTDLNSAVNGLTIAVTGATVPRVGVKAAKPLSLAILPGDSTSVKFELPQFLYAPVKPGDMVGYAVLCVGSEEVSRIPLLADSGCAVLHDPAEKKGLWDSIVDFFH